MIDHEKDIKRASLFLLTALAAVYGGIILTLIPISVDIAATPKREVDLRSFVILILAAGCAFISISALFVATLTQQKSDFDEYTFQWDVYGYGISFFVSISLMASHFFEQVLSLNTSYFGQITSIRELVGNDILYDWIVILAFPAVPGIIFFLRKTAFGARYLYKRFTSGT